MAANDLHTSCRTVFVGVSFFGVMVRPGGKDIVYELEELEKREQPGSYSVHTAQKEKEEREKKKRRKRSELHSLKGKNRFDAIERTWY